MLSLVGPTLQLHHTSELGLFVRAVFDRFPAIAIATSVKRHIIPSTQLAKYLLSMSIDVCCYSTGINYPTVENQLEEKFGDVRIRFRPLITNSEFVSPGKELTDNVSWMQGPSDGEMAVRLEEIVRNLTPPPVCIISDLLAGWSQDVADKFRIPRHVLYTMPASALLFSFACFPSLISPQVAPEHPPGTWNSMVVTTHAFYDYMMRNARRLQEASFILVNTFEDLEGRFLDLMRSEVIGKPNVQVQKILSIGPLIRSSNIEMVSAHSKPSAREEHESFAEVMHWLDAREQSSVLYVSFGSLLTVTETQIHELAHGLEICGRPFLWVYRVPNTPQILPADASTEDSLSEGLPPGKDFSAQIGGCVHVALRMEL
uniref:Glycosyltransferase N-terminal domain-containing protein n=1 Tax=Physcomitrium patens TaxID=3218 RepID=A0A7I4DW77_PHYPA